MAPEALKEGSQASGKGSERSTVGSYSSWKRKGRQPGQRQGVAPEAL